MTFSTRKLALPLLVLTSTSLACQALSGSEGPPGAADPQATKLTNAEVIEFVEQEAQGPGLLCAGTRTGLSCLTAEGWQVYTEDNSGLGHNYLYSGAVCPDGALVLAHGQGFSLFDGEDWREISRGDGFASPEGVACAEDGELWVAHFKGVSHYAKGQWTTYGSENLGSGDSASELVYDVAVAPDGKVWVLGARSVGLFDDEEWTVFQEGQGFSGSRFFNALTLDAAGRPWVAHSSGIDVFQNGQWLALPMDYTSSRSLALDAKGQVWLGTLSDGAWMFDQQAWAKHSQETEDLSSDQVDALVADSSGRVWLGTTYGLTVFDGEDWQTYFMHNSDLGDNIIRFLLVTKDGPELPPLDEKEEATLTGQLEDADGKPLDGMRVEICVETLGSSFSGDTPCSDQPFFLTTETDDDGQFEFDAVPTGYYVVAAETGSGWAQLTDQFGITSERTLIAPGEDYDLGTLTLED